jgi:hypothetical protein
MGMQFRCLPIEYSGEYLRRRGVVREGKGKRVMRNFMIYALSTIIIRVVRSVLKWTF